MDKIRLEDIFPKTLDLRPFMAKFVKNSPALGATDVTKLNERHSTIIAVEEANILNSITPFDTELVKSLFSSVEYLGFTN